MQWWKYPTAVFDKWGNVVPLQQRGGKLVTVIAAWTKTRGVWTRRYALWSNGDLVTQLDAPSLLPEHAQARDVPRDWLPYRRLHMRMTRRNFIKLHRLLVSHGYLDNWRLKSTELKRYLR